ncbi:protein pinocchio-like isoform X2 [Ctenocephalides felis]|uniref:protein pinocchio-like isoform X2 n=1 Tax=Ctenocephalides felis TaxID=7515 RepID=UPI000E6E4C75|nr:protein pinocchio-like isoform X2 [Ctenocephalides felis]
MSMTSIQTPMTELGSNIGRSMSVSSALSEMCRIDYSTINNQHHRKYSQQQAGLSGGAGNNSAGNILTIEELRTQLVSCFTCGVSWADQQVSLDCSECGGYALERPCPLCDGKCGSQPWRRDFTMLIFNIYGLWLRNRKKSRKKWNFCFRLFKSS